MTIRVTIRNEEANGGRPIVVRVCTRPRVGNPRETFGGDVKPGESREFYVHAAQHLLVEEVPS